MPETLAQLVRAKYPGVYDDLSDQALESAVRAKFPGVYDDLQSAPVESQPPAAATRGMLPPSTPSDAMSTRQRRAEARASQPAPAEVIGSMGRDAAVLGRESLPVVGGIAGLALGGPAGAAIGAGGGEAWRQNLRRMVGASAPGTPTEAATDIGLDALLATIPGLLGKAIPRSGRAARRFEQVMGKAGDKPVDVVQEGGAVDKALRVRELADRGGTLPKPVRNFLERVTDSSKGDLSYREARDYYHNISRLSSAEQAKLTPVIRRAVGELRASLDEAVEAAAATVGEGATYRAAMREYAKAAKLKTAAKRGVKYVAGAAGVGAAGAAGMGVYKALQ